MEYNVRHTHEIITSRATAEDKREKKYFTDGFNKYENYYYGTKGMTIELKNKLLAAGKQTTLLGRHTGSAHLQRKSIGLSIVIISIDNPQE